MANVSNKWNGFTEDDIQKISSTKEETKGLQLQDSVTKSTKTQRTSSLKNLTRDHILKHHPKKQLEETRTDNEKKKEPEEKEEEEKREGAQDQTQQKDSNKEANLEIIPHEPGMFMNVEEFQTRQKLMEEKNKKTKELLAKALSDRTKRTSAEAKRLQEIQNELQKLDNILSSDVSVLRNQIETASFEFMEAQKRYDKAEKEFLEAKLHRFTKLERKELLTQHLCTIIEQNELRKAKKLAELMTKLEVESLPAQDQVTKEQIENIIKAET